MGVYCYTLVCLSVRNFLSHFFSAAINRRCLKFLYTLCSGLPYGGNDVNFPSTLLILYIHIRVVVSQVRFWLTYILFLLFD